MQHYIGVVLSGLLWAAAGPVWADGDWCTAMGDLARATVVARDAGVPMATCLRNADAANASDAVRAALRAQVHAAYHGRETPEQARTRAARVCREARAIVMEDLRRRDAGLPPLDP